MNSIQTLFQSVELSAELTLQNRIIMAPLTRSMSDDDLVPTEDMAAYYGRRGDAGLIITEAILVSQGGQGYPNAPGLYNQAQQAGWQKVAKAVHDNNGKIFVQIWHMGAAVHPDFIEGQQAVSASTITLNGQLPTPKGRDRVFEQARALTKKEISHQVAHFVSAAQRAIDAGLDGVEIHAANGFLIDQFTRDSTNQRDDEYGGSIDNRLRFMMEVVAAVCEKIGSDKVGIRISPTNSTWGISDSEYQATFRRAVQMLNAYQLAYLHVLETQPSQESKMEYLTPSIRQEYQGTLIVNGGYDKNRATNAINKNLADAVSFGMPFIANPDLVERYKEDAPLSQPDNEFFYTEGSQGYSDYPRLDMATA